jgi:hypothetical protein
VDRTLLTLVFVLLACAAWEARRSGAKGASPLDRMLWSRETAQPGARRVTRAVPVAAGTPVSLSRSHVSVIARSMADNDWEGIPSSFAADMREQNGFYDVFFALPPRTDPASVKASMSGNVLTLFVNAAGTPAATFAKQFYIPCGAERSGAVETSVSNDVVRVRIRQAGGSMPPPAGVARVP